MTENRWRHKKRGTVYDVLFDSAGMQCASAPDFESMFDDAHWTVYQNVKTGAIWIRPTEEFLDGRFERVTEDSDAGQI